MASIRIVTPRDIDLFAALERTPLTVRQILKLSSTFAYPFTAERLVQSRCQILTAAGRLHSWPAATTGPGRMLYLTLTPESYRILHGHDAQLPGRGLFSKVAISRQGHTMALAEFLVHLMVAAHAEGLTLTEFHRENTLALRLGDETLYPDSAWTLSDTVAGPLRFFVELDAATETVCGTGNLDTIESKIAFYERYRDAQGERFRTLIVTTAGPERVANIVACAKSLARQEKRTLIYVISLGSFLADEQALRTRCFIDHCGRGVTLIPAHAEAPRPLSNVRFGDAPAVMLPSAACLEPLAQV